MRVVLDCYYDDQEQRCLNPKCIFVVGPYSEEMRGACPICGSRLGFFKAFGTEKQRSIQVSRDQAKISGIDY